MSLLLFEHQAVEDAQRHKGHILIRKQHCIECNKVLAMEITDKLGRRGEYYVLKDALHYKGLEPDFLYGKEVWFGNWIKCLNCGREGKLPMDKPLNAELIAEPKEELADVT